MKYARLNIYYLSKINIVRRTGFCKTAFLLSKGVFNVKMSAWKIVKK